ncbi:putative sulfate exporter family transporter [Oxalobacter sp. OttesenSCG-928-P03]|nr:putative sulfate exporter family transporter [Oxalobacter sp. OttesenSCG-928-P03]
MSKISTSPVITRVLFIALLAFCLAPFITTAMALLLGVFFALFFTHPYPELSKTISKYLLQVSIVGLGFGMNLFESLRTGRQGILFTIISVFGVLFLGILVGKWMKLDRGIAYLIAAGTAICGGSAIAAVAPIARAKDSEISVSIGTVFILNAVALLLFPSIGHFFDLSQSDFGTWAAIAIHDTSSVVGAGAAYGEEALKIATTVKLTRALWIIPLCLVTALIFREKTEKMYKPWFIGFFIVAMLINTFFPLPEIIGSSIVQLAKKGFTVTLFLIGTDISLETLKKVGPKAFIFGIILWAVISVSSLAVVVLA